MTDTGRTADPNRRRDHIEIGFGLFLIALCGLVLWGARSIRPAVYDPLGSAALPVAAALIVGGLTLVVLLRSFRRPPRPVDEAERVAVRNDRPSLAIAFLGLTVLYVLVLSLGIGGFAVASAAFLAASGLLLARSAGRTALAVIAIALVLSLGGAYLFTHFFYIALP